MEGAALLSVERVLLGSNVEELDNRSDESIILLTSQTIGVEDEEETERLVVAKHYFVDYENTGGNGLDGIRSLGEGDFVFVFYSKNRNSIPIALIKAINET